MSGLKKFILLAVIGFVSWGYYQKEHKVIRQSPSSEFEKHDPAVKSIQTNHEPIVHAEPQFRCDGRQYCSQMTSRSEAEFFIRNCPNTKMDGDHDGVPCENDSRF